MEAVALTVTEWPRPLAWLREFLKEELHHILGGWRWWLAWSWRQQS